MTPGTSGALEIAMGTLCEHGKTILLPKPGFSLFRCLASSLEIRQKFYTLLVCVCTKVMHVARGKIMSVSNL